MFYFYIQMSLALSLAPALEESSSGPLLPSQGCQIGPDFPPNLATLAAARWTQVVQQRLVHVLSYAW